MTVGTASFYLAQVLEWFVLRALERDFYSRVAFVDFTAIPPCPFHE